MYASVFCTVVLGRTEFFLNGLPSCFSFLECAYRVFQLLRHRGAGGRPFPGCSSQTSQLEVPGCLEQSVRQCLQGNMASALGFTCHLNGWIFILNVSEAWKSSVGTASICASGALEAGPPLMPSPLPQSRD